MLVDFPVVYSPFSTNFGTSKSVRAVAVVEAAEAREPKGWMADVPGILGGIMC